MGGGYRVCVAFDCGNSISPNNPAEFCYVCSSALAHEEKELEKELGAFLTLEAQFFAWCLDHGQPSPHDD